MDRRAAFSRAQGFLNFKPAARWLALAAGIGSCLAFLAFILLLGQITDVFVRRNHSWAAAHVPWHNPNAERSAVGLFGTLTTLAFCAAFAWLFLRSAMHYLALAAATEASLRMRRAVYHQAVRQGGLALHTTGPGEAIAMATRHIEALHDALLASLTLGLPSLVMLALLLLLAASINVVLALLGAIAGALLWMLSLHLTASVRHEARQAVQHAAHELAQHQESLTFLRLMKCHNLEMFQQTRVESELTALATASVQRGRVEVRLHALGYLMAIGGGALFVIATGLFLLEGHLGGPGLVMFGVIVSSAYFPVRDWLEQRRLVRRGEDSAVALFTFLDRPSDVSQTVGAEVLPRLARRIELDAVSLREPASTRALLTEVSLAIPAGHRFALLGPDDLEKYALVYLLARLLDPTAGEVRFDEHNLRWVTLDSLRKQIGVVLRSTYVFSDTVANNITGGDSSVPLPKAMEAAKLAHAHQFIQKLPKGYDTPVGDAGHALNMGERFRLALARAIVRNPALLIIEEPPLAALDDSTASVLDDTYSRVLPGKTVLFLPHREETIHLCNGILLLHEGRLEAQGEHLDLMKQSALYRHLFYVEFNEFGRI